MVTKYFLFERRHNLLTILFSDVIIKFNSVFCRVCTFIRLTGLITALWCFSFQVELSLLVQLA